MSNLGTIYELDLCRCNKNKYPVVYKNDTYYYYKVYGKDALSYSRKSMVYSYNMFKEDYQPDKYKNYTYIFIYVDKGVVPDFSFVNGFSHEELAVSERSKKEQKLVDTINNYNEEIKIQMGIIERNKTWIIQYEEYIKKLQAEISAKQEELNKLRNKEKSK